MKPINQLFIAILFITFYNTSATASIIYVNQNATGNNDGSSWADAYIDLQDALDAYVDEDIWVAAGTYLPTKDPFGSTTPNDSRDKTFFLPDSIKIYGGFTGTETAISQRDIFNNTTILSGDIGIITDDTDNSYHVVLTITSSDVTIDGFSIIGGNANQISFLSFNGYDISRSYGGGIYTYYGTNTITNNILQNNSSESRGGGVYTDYGTNNINNNIIRNNNCETSGGGIYIHYGVNTFSDNNVHNNSADGGSGGGIYTLYGEPTLINNTIHDNTSTLSGGGICDLNGTSVFINNTLYNNVATTQGGGIYMFSGTNNLTNNTLYNNSGNTGGGLYVASGATNLINNIFWDNKIGSDNDVPGADINNNNSIISVINCLSQVYGTDGLDGNIVGQDPLFINPSDPDGADNIAATADDGLALSACSPAIDMGVAPADPIPTDILGNSRIGAYDMGAYENQSTSLVPTNINLEMLTATNPLFSWDAVPGAAFYQVKYRLKGTTAWLTSGTSATQRNIPNLIAKKYYQYKIRAQCSSGIWSDFSDIGLFYTSTCDVPMGIASIYLDNTRMRIRWDNNPNEIKAKVRYREVGTSTWYTQNSQVGNNYLYINNLTPNATYQYRVRSNCDGNDWSAYSGSYFHDLMSPRLGQEIINQTAMKIYPNPTKNNFNVEFETQNEEVTITISNHLGKVVYAKSKPYQKGVQIENIDMSSFADGYYFITIQNGDRMETSKFVKIK